jgi:cysteine sulfinate desulfinase/cysteine desulfurase-like protein
LKALALIDADAYACVLFSLGRFTTHDEIDYAIDKVVCSAHRLRRSKSAS